MNMFATLTATAAFAAFGFTVPATAGDLPMTSALSCDLVDDHYFVAWQPIDSGELEKYTASIECTDPEDEDVETGEYDAGTGDCYDGTTGEGVEGVECDGMLATEISVAAYLIVDEFDANPLEGDSCIVKLRGLHSGPDKGRQDRSAHAEAIAGCDEFP